MHFNHPLDDRSQARDRDARGGYYSGEEHPNLGIYGGEEGGGGEGGKDPAGGEGRGVEVRGERLQGYLGGEKGGYLVVFFEV